MDQHEPDESESQNPPKESGRFRKAFRSLAKAQASIIGIVVGGVLGFAGSTMAANISADAQVRVAKEQLDHAASLKTKEQRDETYRAYLSAVEEYRYATEAMFGKPAPTDVKAAYSRFITARSNFQGQINEVYVYGSDEALRAHLKIAKTLPRSLGQSDLSFKATDLSDEKTFIEAYNAFLKVRCLEVTATQRQGCAD